MHPDVRRAFADIISKLPAPHRVIEIGQDRAHAALIDLPQLEKVAERVAAGFNAGGTVPGISYLTASAHDLAVCPDGHFDLLLCNSMLEHDPHFWCSLAEMRRITKPGGYMVIGVPGFGAMTGPRRGWRRLAHGLIAGRNVDAAAASTPTLGLHAFPDDFYRFSRSAVDKVLLAGCSERQVIEVMSPPRLIGVGQRAQGEGT